MNDNTTQPAPFMPPVPEEVPAGHVSAPAGNMPPPDLLNPVVGQTAAPPLTTPPGLQNAESSGPVSTPKGGGPLKKILLISGLLAFGVIIFLVVFKVLLPMLSRSGVPVPFLKDKEIVWWGLWEDESVIKPLIDEYESTHPNVKITYIQQNKNDYRERLVNSLAQGTGPDIFRYHNSWVPMLAGRLSLVPENIYNSKTYSETFYPVVVSNLTTKQGIVGIPLMYDGLALFINEEIFSTYGALTPKTWDDLRDTAAELTIKDENGIIQQSGAALGVTTNVDHWQEILALMMVQNGVDMTNPQDVLAEGALKFFTSFSNDEYQIWDESLPNSTVYFASGRLAMYLGPSWRVFEILEQNPSLRFKIVPVPQLPKESETDPDITYATYWVEGVNNTSSVSEEAWDFLKYLSQKDTLEKFYQNASQVSPNRRFGEIYPRQDMAELIYDDPLVGGFVKLAPNAKSWYLASRTYDGATGMNSRLSDYFADAVNALSGSNADRYLVNTTATLASGVQQVLVDYGLIAPPPPVEE